MKNPENKIVRFVAYISKVRALKAKRVFKNLSEYPQCSRYIKALNNKDMTNPNKKS